ncbi:APC family permease [Streptomyces sp. NPDC054808]
MSKAEGSADSGTNLKRTITLPQALGITFHQIVGAGILAILGSGIALTGGGTPLALLITSVAIPLATIPYAAMASAVPTSGGMYAYAARVLHPGMGFLNLSFVVLGQISVGLTALSAGIYLRGLNPWFSPKAVAVALILLFFLINLLGASFSARVGIVLAAVMLASYAVFAITGFAHIDWAHYPAVLPDGMGGLLQASALMTFVLGGGTFIAELGGELKNPGRAIPVSIVGGTLFAGALYVLLALPAVGVLPVPEVAGQPLTVVAEAVMPRPLFIFFVLGGGLMASVGTLNASLTWGTKGLLMAVQDGWFPSRAGQVNKRFGTPHYLLIGVTLIGLSPILLGLGLKEMASGVSAFLSIAFIILTGASLRLRQLRPDSFRHAAFRLPAALHAGLSVIAVPVFGTIAYLLLSDLPGRAASGIVGWLILSAGWFAIRYPKIRPLLLRRAQEFTSSQEAIPGTTPQAVEQAN